MKNAALKALEEELGAAERAAARHDGDAAAQEESASEYRRMAAAKRIEAGQIRDAIKAFLAACVHTPIPCDAQWPRTCEERGDAVQAVDAKPERPADPKDDHSRDDNGGSSEGNSDDGNGGKS